MALTLTLLVSVHLHAAGDPLPGTAPLAAEPDRSARMVEGIDRFLMRALSNSVKFRDDRWQQDLARAPLARVQEDRRSQLRRILGAVEPRVPTRIEQVSAVAETPVKEAGWTVETVRWPVFTDVFGEGLLVRPVGLPRAWVIVVPDADQVPEQLIGLRAGVPAESQVARILLDQGCAVLIPVLINRDDTHSGNAPIGRFTNQPHREWLYRQGFELGRHLIGCEVQKLEAAADALLALARVVDPAGTPARRLGLFGYGEGGLLALHAAALNERFSATVVSGYFGSRENLWEEPIYRNIFAQLTLFGDAELAALVHPRPLLLEYSVGPVVTGPPAPRPGRAGAAPGRLGTAEFEQFMTAIRAANERRSRLPDAPRIQRFYNAEGTPTPFGNARTLLALLEALGFPDSDLKPSGSAPGWVSIERAPELRQQRQVHELEEHMQRIFRASERTRDALTWTKLAGSTNDYAPIQAANRSRLRDEVIGRIDAPKLSPAPRSRWLAETPAWTSYEVTLDVFPEVFAWGYLLLPKDLKPGERRPVVVCQHGLESMPEDTVAMDPRHRGWGPYRGFAARLADRGFIVYSPHNPYRGQDRFRVLQRKANPLGLSLFSFIVAQHEVTTAWLAELPFVDPTRIGFYGLSYGGKTAMRVPALVDRYCLSICSADFNEWIRKNTVVDSGYSYVFTGEYEMPEWNLAHTYNYAEMAMLIAPRPFMVERGHDDGVAPDPWVAYEYAKVRRGYTKLGIADRTEIEFFDGPHTINGVGTFKFLHRHLRWPEPGESGPGKLPH